MESISSKERYKVLFQDVSYTPVKRIHDPKYTAAGVQLWVKREDTIHPQISGNKWRKLKYNLHEAIKKGYSRLLTFGGAYSNHIAATAYAGKAIGLETIGIIRGEKTLPLNHTLREAQSWGMQFHYLDRTSYRLKKTPEVLDKLQHQFGPCYIVPEGGTNCLALKGCQETVLEIKEQFRDSMPNYIALCCGTGGTAAGMISVLKGQSKVIGFSILKGDFHKNEIHQLLTNCIGNVPDNWQVNTDYHLGGYAKTRPSLLIFINRFKEKHGIPLDPIYTGKLFYGLDELILQGKFPPGSKILAIHTGGLQGIKGFNERFGNLIKE